jgi:hypothetical protein
MSSPTGLSSSRKKLVIAGILLAIWGTVATALMFTGFFAETSEEAAGMVFVFLILFPTLIGFGVSLCAQESRLQNPASVWVPIIWNALITLLCIGLIVAGILMKA